MRMTIYGYALYDLIHVLFLNDTKKLVGNKESRSWVSKLECIRFKKPIGT